MERLRQQPEGHKIGAMLSCETQQQSMRCERVRNATREEAAVRVEMKADKVVEA
jgi:hypothetical protein